MCWKEIGCLLSNFSTFQTFQKVFSLFKSVNNWWYKLLIEDLHQQNEQVFELEFLIVFISVRFIDALLAMTVFSFLCRDTHCSIFNNSKNYLEIINFNVRFIGLKHSLSGIVFSFWEKPKNRCYEILQASAWYILTNLQMIWRFLGNKEIIICVNHIKQNCKFRRPSCEFFSNLVNFSCESSDFCRETCGSTESNKHFHI